MANMTLSIPEELHKKIRKHSEIRWSEIARKAIAEYIEKLELMDESTKESKLTKEDVKEISKEIKKSIAKRHRTLLK